MLAGHGTAFRADLMIISGVIDCLKVYIDIVHDQLNIKILPKGHGWSLVIRYFTKNVIFNIFVNNVIFIYDKYIAGMALGVTFE